MPHQTLRSDGGTGRADRQHLGMGGRIMQFARPVARLRDHLTTRPHDHGSHRHLAARACRLRLCQRLIHERAKYHPITWPQKRLFRKAVKEAKAGA